MEINSIQWVIGSVTVFIVIGFQVLLLKQKQRLQKEITSREAEIIRPSGMVAKHLYKKGKVVDKIILRERFSHTVCTGS